MTTVLTFVGFFAVTAVCVLLHLRRAVVAPAPVPINAVPCPRCAKPVPEGAAFCPSCGVPRQVYEVVFAATAAAPFGSTEDPAAPTEHALVRADLCVGCGSCVAACPEAGAITLAGKLAVVNKDACTGQSACVAACPVGAITMSSGDAVQRVYVPEVDAEFESNLPGIYIVGELGGRGLIKNAINEGKIAVEAIVRRITEEQSATQEGAPARVVASSGDLPMHDLVIVGAGPAGLSAGLEATRAKLDLVVIEQGTLADSIRRYPRRKILLAEPLRVPLYGDLWIADTTKEALLEVWESIVRSSGIVLRSGQRVDGVERVGDHFRVFGSGEDLLTRRVLLAMGRRGTPRRLGVPGEDRENVFYQIVEMEPFQGRRVLVVGGGDSALEAAVGLANQSMCEVSLSYRGESFLRAKERNRSKLKESVAAGKVRLLLSSSVREIKQDAVLLNTPTGSLILPNDDLIVQIGGVMPSAFLERIGVRMVHKNVPLPEGEGVIDA